MSDANSFNAIVTQRMEVAPGLIVLRVAPAGWELPDFEPDGSSTVSGEMWDRYVETGVSDPDVALVQQRPDSVVVILGSDGYDELESFASSLR